MDPAESALVLSSDSAAFLAHWRQVRGEALMPSLEAWIAKLPASLAPRTFRAEVVQNDALLLFLGSDLIARAGQNTTGQSLYALAPHRRVDGMKNMREVVDRPTGFCFKVEHVDQESIPYRTETVVLPLAPSYGRLPQIVGFSVDLDPRPPSRTVMPSQRVPYGWWIDIGHSTPPLRPV